LKTLYIVALVLLLPALVLSQDSTISPGGTSHYLRGAYQFGAVLQTNAFVKGENNAGVPIDRFHSIRLDVGWQTDGSEDWHHLYKFPSYGFGIYGADFFNDRELGKPTSLYGFFCWPLGRSDRWQFNVDLAFGLTENWESYDPVDNPNNIAIGAGRSVHIETGINAEYRLANQWSLIGGLTATHFSNGGTQRPNHGLNITGPVIYLKHHQQNTPQVPSRLIITGFNPSWDLTFTISGGIRNLNLDIRDHDQRVDYLNRNFFVGNYTLAMGRRFSPMSRYCFGLDVTYDQSVPALQDLAAYAEGKNAAKGWFDQFDVAAFGGYEHIINNTHLLLQLGYIFLRDDVNGRLPAFYQRLGLKQFVSENWFCGLNVRFHEIGSADNLEWNVGFISDL